MLACRMCRIPLSALHGCAGCNPIRKNLIVVGEDEDDRPSLATTGGEIVSALRSRLKVIRKELNGETDDDKVSSLEKRLIAVSNSASKILESARKVQADGISAVEQMSFAERAELFIGWITELTPAYRKALRDRWEKWEANVSKPLLESKVRDED